jgi:hypothetical protein
MNALKVGFVSPLARGSTSRVVSCGFYPHAPSGQNPTDMWHEVRTSRQRGYAARGGTSRQRGYAARGGTSRQRGGGFLDMKGLYPLFQPK